MESYEETKNYALTGLTRAGKQSAKLKRNYAKALEVLVERALLQASFVILDDALKITYRHVNIIGHAITPWIECTRASVMTEMEEKE